MDRDLYDTDEAAAKLHLGRSKTIQLIMSGELKSLKIGRARRVPASAISDYIQSRLEQEELAVGD